MRRVILPLVAVGTAAYAGWRLVVEPWWRTWGVISGETEAPMPGDDILPDAGAVETRGIVIAATPEQIWPWLVQMGYGRAGWYSYDMVDMAGASSDRVVPELQELKVGDMMGTHPGGGFVVRALEPNRSLVLYSDTALMQQQAASAEAGGEATGEAPGGASDAQEMPPNLKATGALMAGAQPTEFAVSWSFVLEPIGDSATRLVERVRASFGETDKPWTRYTLPMMGFGVFVMIRRQLIGIKDRVEGRTMPVIQQEAAV